MRDSVLITGTSSVLGQEMALYLAERGFQVYATMRDLGKKEPLEAAAQSANVKLRVLRLDVTDGVSINEVVQTIVKESGGIYGLVNNAGISLWGYFEDLSDKEIHRVFEVNVLGTMAVTRAVLPYMRTARRGRIVTITSVGGKIGAMGVSAYCASRFAQEGFGESLAQEVQPLGLHGVLIEPAVIKTAHWRSANRVVAKGALDSNSPYYDWFNRLQLLTDRLVESSPTKPLDVAKVVYRALTVKRPRFRYMVGRRAGLVITLRRYLPSVLFERFYFGTAIRWTTKPKRL